MATSKTSSIEVDKNNKKLSILSAKSDYIFKLIFGDERNKEILISFLKAVLDLPLDEYEIIEISDPHLRKIRKKGKLAILDIKIRTKSGNLLAIEIQIIDTDEMKERVIFGLSKLINEQIKSGDGYKIIKRAISILITDFTLIKENDAYYNRFRFYNPETNTEFSDIMEINTLELDKIPKELDSETNKEKWLWMRFLKAKNEEELDMLSDTSTAMRNATVILKKLSQSDKIRAEYEAREQAIRDEISRMNSAKRKGLKEGIEIGRQEGEQKRNIEIAKNLLNIGISLNQISEVTGLSIQEIERL